MRLELKKTHSTLATSPSTNVNSPQSAINKKVNFSDKVEGAIKKDRKVTASREGDINVYRVNLIRLTKTVPEHKDKRKGLMASTVSWRNNRKVGEG